jgi:uncharacterized protein
MDEDQHERQAGGTGPAEVDLAHRLRLSRRAVLAVTLAALVLGGAGLGLALSDAGASTPVAAPPPGCGASMPHLTVQGTGQDSAPPDVLTAVFSFSSTASSSSAALSDDNAKVNDALLALEAHGVQQPDIQTTGLSLAAQYAYPQGEPPTLTGYTATNTLSATLRNTKTAGAAIDAVVSASGDNAQISSLSFSFSNPAKIEDEARAKAVHQAVAHAGAMASAAGRRLGRVCSLTDDTQPSQVPTALGFAGNSASSAGAVPVEPGSQTETDQVTMVYALDQR